MNRTDCIVDVGEFLTRYSTHMMGSGVHTSRVVRCTKRLGESFGYKVRLNIFQKTMVIYVEHIETHEIYNRVVDIPALPISFEHNTELSALSWEAYDEHLPLSVVNERFEHISSHYSVRPWMILIMASIANGAFCAIFGGDALSIFIVFCATMVGFFVKQRLAAMHVNHFFIFIICAFIASACASSAFFFDTTKDIAIATSVLYLIPGVPLINGFIDVLEGYHLSGISRLIQAFLLIICIAIGLSFTLMFVKNGLL